MKASPACKTVSRAIQTSSTIKTAGEIHRRIQARIQVKLTPWPAVAFGAYAGVFVHKIHADTSVQARLRFTLLKTAYMSGEFSIWNYNTFFD